MDRAHRPEHPPDPRPDPDDLLQQARGGRTAALGPLLELYRNYLHLLARTQIDLHLGRRANPSDLVQETFLEAFRDFDSFRGGSVGEFRAWLRRILVHNLGRLVAAQVTATKRSVRREVSLRGSLAALERSTSRFDQSLVSSWSSPSAREERLEVAAILADQLAKLPARQREVIVLRNLEGLSFDEVAEKMGATAGAVRMLWLRALARLKDYLEEEDLI
jgi:RNA polymerase sigma-70 factor (ECF subfamily)